ncbi:hypothetical protein N7451_012649 [Penicillium sp. IBT 35674x]|nr:hypothetical protein N7451_012649 [Penicillium sp. IBT 35674x]
MTSLLRLQLRLQAYPLRRQTVLSTHSLRTYAQYSSKSEDKNRSAQRDSGGTEGSPNHPIPSNKAHPTLQDGKQSPLADFEGKLREDCRRM